MVSTNKRKKKSNVRKWIYWITGIFLAILLIGGSLISSVTHKIASTVAEMHEPLKRDIDRDRQNEIETIFQERKSLNLLLLAIDEQREDEPHVQFISLISMNPQTSGMNILSIPVEATVDLQDESLTLEEVYTSGGTALTIDAIEQTFNLPAHFYVKVTMQGIEEGTDILGGITIENDHAYTTDMNHFQSGQIELNGAEVIDFLQWMTENPNDDPERMTRQNKVVGALTKGVINFSGIFKAGDALDLLASHVKTDMDLDMLQALYFTYENTQDDMKYTKVNGDFLEADGATSYIISEDEIERIHSAIKEHMEAQP